MLEESALAIINVDQRRLDKPELASIDEFRMESDRGIYMLFARAVLERLRDPTEAMIESGFHAQDHLEREDVKTTWIAMIDAALADK